MASRECGDVTCARMTAATRPAAERLLARFLDADPHYQASAATYGDGGIAALSRALDLFLARPELGFVWIAERDSAVVGACVVCHAISTARGGLVAKLDDVTVDPARQREGIGAAMLDALAGHLRARGFGRIDTACHRDNDGAWRFYERLGYRSLHEERIARLL
jgi:ribosomal protein S18 acetylase RimI-like enzyme